MKRWINAKFAASDNAPRIAITAALAPSAFIGNFRANLLFMGGTFALRATDA